MLNTRRSIAAVVTAVAAPTLAAVPTAHADPLPSFCVPADVIDNVCTVRLASVTADVVDGKITGTPVDGGTAVTLAGPEDAYRTSTGFGDTPPDPIRRWDDTISSLSSLPVDSSDPNWYGNAKARVLMSRTLNGLATEFPENVLIVSFTPDGANPGSYRLISVQPTPHHA